MINAKLILPVALAIATSITGVSAVAAANAGDNDVDIHSEFTVQYEERLSEKLEAGEITQEQYDETIAAIESGDFHGAWSKGAVRGIRGNAAELTEEQKAELSAKKDEMLSEMLEAGKITQEQYDEIIAAMESGDFSGHGLNFGKLDELTEEQKAELSEKWSENAWGGRFGGMFGNHINDKELTDEQKAEITEKQSNRGFGAFGGFGAFRGSMRGNFGARGK